MPNGPIPEEKPLEYFKTSLAELEANTGLLFFPRQRHQGFFSTLYGNNSQIPTTQYYFKDLCLLRKDICKGNQGSFSHQYRVESQFRSAPTNEACHNIYKSTSHTSKAEQDYRKCLNRTA